MDKLLAPLLTRFSVIRLKSYTKEEFVEIVVKVLNRDEGIEKYMIELDISFILILKYYYLLIGEDLPSSSHLFVLLQSLFNSSFFGI